MRFRERILGLTGTPAPEDLPGLRERFDRWLTRLIREHDSVQYRLGPGGVIHWAIRARTREVVVRDDLVLTVLINPDETQWRRRLKPRPQHGAA